MGLLGARPGNGARDFCLLSSAQNLVTGIPPNSKERRDENLALAQKEKEVEYSEHIANSATASFIKNSFV